MNKAVTKSEKTSLSVAEKIGLLALGGGIGAIAALLLTPKRGDELRGGIATVSRKSLERSRETAHEIGAHVGEYYGATKTRAGVIYHTAEEKARALAEQARAGVEAPRGTLAAAIEAGKRAYWEEKRRSEAASILKGRAAYPYELGDGASDAKR